VYDWYIHNLEIESADRYYFWNSVGLAGDRLPTAKLNNLKRAGPASLSCDSILFISTVFLRYPFFRYSPNLIGQGIEMLNLQFQFYKKLSIDLRRNLVLRQNTSGHGDSFRYKKRWVDFSEGKICFDNFKTCEESIKNSKIVLVDHISTTWIEAIFINKPIIIYFDYSHDYIEDRVQILFRLLESVSVLHKTPESAAIFLNDNYENIDAWWGSDRVSSAISEIKEYFYNDCDGFVEKWTNELLDVESQCNNNK
jgi:putative transferase (TIGR04331 family)